jgi:hypothetical protein
VLRADIRKTEGDVVSAPVRTHSMSYLALFQTGEASLGAAGVNGEDVLEQRLRHCFY